MSQSHARTASSRSRLESRSALRVIRKSDRNQASCFEFPDQPVESGGGLLTADVVFLDQDGDDLTERASRLNEIPDARADLRQPVIHAVAQAEDHDLVGEPGGQLVVGHDHYGVGRERLAHSRSVSHGASRLRREVSS
jgi:hypothetical protein